MDRNSIIGLLLIFAILGGYAYLNQPSAEQLAEQKRYSDSIALVNQELQQLEVAENTSTTLNIEEEVKGVDTQSLVQAFGDKAAFFFGEEKLTTLKTEKLSVEISNKGARIVKAVLPEFSRADTSSDKTLVLFDLEHGDDHYEFELLNNNFETSDAYWEIAKQSDKHVAYRLIFDENSYIESSFTIDEDGYGVNHELQMVQMDKYITKSELSFYRQLEVPKQELKAETEREKSTIYFKYVDEKPDYIGETKYKTEVMKAPTQWVSFKQQFFNTAIIYEPGFLRESEVTTIEPTNELENVKLFKAQLDLPFENKSNEQFSLRFYFGPNHYYTLKDENVKLESIIPLGWTLFRWVNQYLVIPTFYFLNQFINSYGIIILLLTIFIKLLLLPLVYKSYLSTAKMRLLKPELDVIKEKNKDDMGKIQMETMKLYKKAGVSPLGGCLPLFLQFPILIAMFSFFPASFELRQKSFLWADDLSRYDSILDLGFSIPFYGDHVSLFTLLMTVSTIIYTRMNNQLTAAGPQMKIFSYLMPIMFLGFFNNYPAALSYYYFLANMITFGQQFIMKRFVDEDKLHKQIAENKKRPVTLKKTGLQKRIENYAKSKGIDPNTGKRKK
jgi:YidC/Oxa1 family membrane protein insertase